MEHSESKPVLAFKMGNLARSGKALKLDNLRSYDGWVHIQAGRINQGSPALSTVVVNSDQVETQVMNYVVWGVR